MKSADVIESDDDLQAEAQFPKEIQALLARSCRMIKVDEFATFLSKIILFLLGLEN